jgi:serine protease Do
VSGSTAIADPGTESTAHLARVLEGGAPRSLDELKEIQRRIREVTETILPATVAIQVDRANGSGVIIDRQGYVLTAAHVAGQPGRAATIHLPDGRTVYGSTLGLNQQLDSGLIRISGRGPWPYVPLGKSANVKDGQWCLATGHPGGFLRNRPPVLRWGRVLRIEDSAILTDCTLVGGDSGGPLFDLEGRVIGVHSRIGKNLTINVHVPVDPFVQSWDRLVRGEVWGLLAEEDEEEVDDESGQAESGPPISDMAWLGVTHDPQSAHSARIRRVAPNSPAARAGLQPGDIILSIDDVEISSFDRLQNEIRARTPGDRIRVQVRRNDGVLPLQVQLGGRLHLPQP